MGVIELKRKHDAAAVNSSLVRRPIRRWAPLFMGPMLCAFAIGFVYPFCKGVYLSFCKFKTTSDAQFIGFGNYIKALNDASFIHSFWYTALFALVSLVFINVLAFAVAYALTQGIKGSNLFRTVFFMPNLIGGIVLGYVWSMIFDGILSRYGTSILLETKYGFWGIIWSTCQISHDHVTKLCISLQELLHFACNSSFHICSQKVYKFLFEATGGTPLFFE